MSRDVEREWLKLIEESLASIHDGTDWLLSAQQEGPEGWATTLTLLSGGGTPQRVLTSPAPWTHDTLMVAAIAAAAEMMTDGGGDAGS